MENTLTIIKPDSVSAGNAGKIIAHLEAEGFEVVALRKMRLSQAQAEGFYAVHSERPFFGELVEFMTSGPCVVMILEGEDAIKRNREIMGATNPAEAAEGTLRKLFAESIGRNAVHGSDSPENAAIETAYFFQGIEVH